MGVYQLRNQTEVQNNENIEINKNNMKYFELWLDKMMHKAVKNVKTDDARVWMGSGKGIYIDILWIYDIWSSNQIKLEKCSAVLTLSGSNENYCN